MNNFIYIDNDKSKRCHFWLHEMHARLLLPNGKNMKLDKVQCYLANYITK